MYNFLKILLVLIFCFFVYLIQVVKGAEKRIEKENKEKLKKNGFDIKIDKEED